MVPNTPPNVRPNFAENAVPQNPQNQVPQFIRYPNQTGTPINRIVPSPGIIGNQMMVQNINQQNQVPQMNQQVPQIQNQMMYQQVNQINQSNQPQQQQQQIIGPNGQVIVQQGGQGSHPNQIGVMQNNGNLVQGQIQTRMNTPQPEIRSPNRQDFGQRMQQQQQQQFYGNIPYQNSQQFDPSKGPRPNFVPNNGNGPFPGYRTDQHQIPVQNQQLVDQNQKQNHWQQKPGTPGLIQNVPIQNIPSPHSQMQSPHQNMMSPHGNPNPFDRVPPLHHHTPPPPVWNEDINKRKVQKMNKASKKQRPYTDQRFGSNESCPNVDVRQLNHQSDNYQSPGPSFMEDPSGYLAQQTALLNSTISRQTGVNNCNQNYMCHSPNMQSPTPQNPNLNLQKNHYNNRINVQSVQVVQKANQENPNVNLPDSSATENNYGNEKKVQQVRNQVRMYQNHGSDPSTPNSFEENPVTSSTFSEKYGNYVPSPDSRPIQGGTVSTSNGSPIDGQPQSEPSSAPSTPTPQQRNSDTPLMSLGNPNSVATSICTTTAPMMNTSSGQQKIEGYCPHPHAVGSPLGMPKLSTPFSVHDMVTITASGRTFGSNTITSVLAGRASTSTVSINAPASIPMSSVQSFNTSQSGLMSTAQNQQTAVSKSPLEMVQSVVSSIQLPNTQTNVVNTQLQQISPTQIVKSPQSLPPGHILVSSGGQLLMATTGNGQQNIMVPPPPKLVSNTSPMPPLTASQIVTNVTASVTQVIPAVAQQVLGQQTVLVNALPTPFVIQPGVVTVDGMAVGQNMQIPHLVTGNVIQQQIQIDGQQENRNAQHHSPGFNRQPALLSPESNKKKGKKRKMSSSQTVASMLHIASQQNSNVVVQPQQGFSQQNFQMAHSPQGIQGPMLQALTIVPGKPGVPSQIVMNGQQNNFGQQIITNSQPAPQINLLQPVNLLNGTGVVQNFPTIQQFIVPNLGGMVMTADGTLIQDQNIGMQLQLQNVNGQNVLTQVQNSNVFTGGQSILGTAGMVIRTPNTQGKIIQQQHSPGAQFLSPNGGQFVMNGTQFNGQLSPLVANVSPTQQVTFSTSPQQVRPATSLPQEFIQCNQMGQTLMVPCAPAQAITVTSASNQQNTTYVQQNTTIVQQQTTMVSNNQIQNFGLQNQNNQDQQNFIINQNQNDKSPQIQHSLILQRQSPKSLAMMRQSVSTQTAQKQNIQTPSVTTNTFCQTSMSTSASSPPDTTTHSPLAAGGQSPTNADTTTHSVGMGSTDEGLSPAPSNSSVGGNYTDTITIQGRQSSSMVSSTTLFEDD